MTKVLFSTATNVSLLPAYLAVTMDIEYYLELIGREPGMVPGQVSL